MKRGTPDHPKTHALAAELKIERFAAVGLLEMLWHFTAHYAKRGNVGRHTDLAIARAIGWSGDPEVLIGGLMSCGWLDRCTCHRLVVHDWAKHADQGVGRSEEVKTDGFVLCQRQKLDDSSSQLDKDSLPLPLPLPLPSLAKPEPAPLPVALAARETAPAFDATDSGPRTPATPEEARAVAIAVLGPPNGNGGTEEPWPTVEAYGRAVWAVYRERRGNPDLEASSKEFALIRRWWDERVPVRVVATGLRMCKGEGRSLLYYGGAVDDEIGQARKMAFGGAKRG